MSKIQEVSACTVVIPTDAEIAFARRTVSERHYVLVRITDSDGNTGIGFCYAGNFGGPVLAAAVRDLIAPIVVGKDRHAVKKIWDEVSAHTLLHGRAGLVVRALSACDIAIWDCNARAVGLPLHRYLGAAATDAVPAYASGGYYRDGKTPEDLADEVRGYVTAGFGAVKIKVGRVDAAADEERLAAVRDAVGPDVLVMLDANNAWKDLPTAVRSLARWERYDPYWIEEPFGPDDIHNHARLAERTPVIVATGEIEAGRWRHKELLDAGAASILQTDAAVCGGITEFQRIAALAEGYGVTMSPHWFHDLHVHLVASISNGQFVEYFPDTAVLNFGRLITRQLEVVDGGHLALPSEAGLGFDYDPEALALYAVEEWR